MAEDLGIQAVGRRVSFLANDDANLVIAVQPLLSDAILWGFRR